MLRFLHLLAAKLGGGDPGDIRGRGTGFGEFCWQFLARDGGIGLIFHFLKKSLEERHAEFVTFVHFENEQVFCLRRLDMNSLF